MNDQIDLRKQRKVDADGVNANLLIVQNKLDIINASIRATGTWSNGTETLVGAVAVQIQAANPNRKRLIIQNLGNGAARIGITGVTATTGVRLNGGGILILEPPYQETNAIYAIREGAVNTTILTQETT